MTKYGKQIARIVLSSRDHPTAEQIYLRLQEQGSPISLATVYNNLKTLTEEGILCKVSLDGSPDRYDRPAHHQHLICAGCGKLADVELGDLTETLEQQLGFPIRSYELRVSYLCEDCRKKQASSAT